MSSTSKPTKKLSVKTNTKPRETRDLTPNSSKRKIASNNSSPDSTPNAKKATLAMGDSDVPLTIEAIKMLLSEQTKSIEVSIRNEVKTLGDELKSNLESQISQLNDKIDTIQNDFQSQIDKLTSDIDTCKHDNNKSDDDMQRMNKLNELKITGIAHTSIQNLHEIFCEIAKIINFDMTIPTNTPAIMRIYKRNPATKEMSPTSIIIAKFVANHIRDNFYSLYLNKIAANKPIMTENLNLPKGTRIIIGENLTQNNSKIFIEASKLKREGKLCQVFTQEGLVQVKAIKTARATSIRSQRQLELFMEQNAAAKNNLQTQNQPLPPPTTTTENTTAATNTPRTDKQAPMDTTNNAQN